MIWGKERRRPSTEPWWTPVGFMVLKEVDRSRRMRTEERVSIGSAESLCDTEKSSLS